MEPKDFELRAGLSVSDFDFTPHSKLDPSSVASMAAKESAISGGDYPAIRDGLTNSNGRQSWVDMHSARMQELVAETQSELSNIMLDPTLSAEQRAEMLNLSTNVADNLPSLGELLLENGLLAPVEEEDEAAFASRSDLVDMIADVNTSKERIQGVVNAYAASLDPNFGSMVADFGELMVPFSEFLWFRSLENSEGRDIGLANLGGLKEKVFKQWKSLPFDQQERFIQEMLNYVHDNPSLVVRGENDLFAIDALEKISGMSDYSDAERVFDNVVGVLDAIGMGWAAKAAVDVFRPVSIAQKMAVRGKPAPTSPASAMRVTNDTSATEAHIAVAADETGELAEPLYGTSRSDALADDLLPEPDIMPNEVPVKPRFDEPGMLRDTRKTRGGSEFTQSEVDAMVDIQGAKLQNVDGMKLHPNSLKIVTDNDDGSIVFKALYHPIKGGWRTANKALENAEYAFREQGLTKKDFTLLARRGDSWVETTESELRGRKALRDGFTAKKQKIPADLKDLDYAVSINFRYQPGPADIPEQVFERFTIKANWFDRLPAFFARLKSGSVQQHIIPADNMFQAQFTRPASAAVDREVRYRKLLVETFEKFSKAYSKLKAPRREQMRDYIEEANHKGLKFNVTELYARGFSEDEIATLKEWRRANDAMWYSTNQDLALSMRNKGMMLFKDLSGTKLVVKPVKRGGVSSSTKFKDTAVEGASQSFSKQELDDLYESGGYIAKLPEPTKMDGEWVENIIVRNNTDAFARRINDDDLLLAYRDGYYPVMYDAHFFVEETLKDGSKITVGAARTQKEAQKIVDDFISRDETKTYSFREDKNNPQEGFSESDSVWALATNAGTSAQRLRGQRLVAPSDPEDLTLSKHLVDPLESVAAQISQLARRIEVRPWLETSKARWLASYSKYLDLPKGPDHSPAFPNKVEDIKLNLSSGGGNKDLADARSMFNYIHALENGYVNQIDDGIKMMMHFGANMLEAAGATKASAALRDATRGASATSKAKGTTFKLFLAANPPRQLVIQGHQVVQLTAINPTYLAGPMQRDLFRLGKVMRGVVDDPEAVKMWEELQRSGLQLAVDANNLVRQDELRLAELSTAGKTKKALVDSTINLAQKVGFDTAEQFVLVTSWLTHRDMAIKAGKRLTRRELENIAGQSRIYTYNMNRAGDMPYNQNSLNVILQFLQVPHKAILQPLMSRSLDPVQKTRLLAWNGLMYGVPAGIFGSLLPDRWFSDGEKGVPSVSKQILEQGLEDVMFNYMLSQMYGEDVQIDWGDLAPGNIYGFNEQLVALATLNFSEAVANAPATSLFFGNNPRVSKAFTTTARYFHLVDDYDDPELDTKYTDVVNSAMSLFSGYSNGFKARYAYHNGKKINSYGNITDDDVNRVEAAAQLFGFRTKTEEGVREARDEFYGDAEYRSQLPKDVEKWYTTLKQHLGNRSQTLAERDLARRALSEAMAVFGPHQQEFRKELVRLIQRDADRGIYDFTEGLRAEMGIMDEKDVREIIAKMPRGPERDALIESLDIVLLSKERAESIVKGN